ncbi:MAG TPA: DUF362 domain-containing protein [Bryobacteraceae bacterium]|nr:DUF362 domain-containing protein [Bryobacteraceae bacterium]
MSRTLDRRSLVTGSVAALAAAGCSVRRSAAPPPAVSILRAPEYGPGLYAEVRRVLEMHRLNVRGKRVVLKPNLVEFEPQSAINTHPMFVHATLEAFRAMGAAEVRIAEGPGHRRNTLDLADAAGYFQAIPNFEDIFTDLNLDEVSLTRLRGGYSRLDSLYLPNTALRCDLLVSLPKLKTHHWTGATLSMKNLFGLVPGGVYGWPKNVLHWAGIHECIADLHVAFPRQFALVDGIVGMEGNGPIQGTPRRAGVLVAGRDVVAVDATCCRIMGIDPLKIGYLRLVAGEDTLAESHIQQIGEPVAGVTHSFELLPQFRAFRLRS